MFESKNKISVRQAVLENAASPTPCSPVDLARELGVRVESVYESSSRLRREGRLRASTRQASLVAHPDRVQTTSGQPGGFDTATPDVALDPSALLAGLETEVVLTEHDRRRILSRLARVAPDPVKVQAVRALEEMDRVHGTQVGPPPPMTEEEEIERLAVLLGLVGREVGHRAWARAEKSDEWNSPHGLIGTMGPRAVEVAHLVPPDDRGD